MGILNNVGLIDFNSVWFNFLVTWLNALLALLLGGDPTAIR